MVRYSLVRPTATAEGLLMDNDATTEMHSVLNRLKRAQGQLGGVIRMVEEGRDCSDVVTQLSAVHRALGRAGFDVIAVTMKECLATPESGDGPNLEELRRLFLSLA